MCPYMLEVSHEILCNLTVISNTFLKIISVRPHT